MCLILGVSDAIRKQSLSKLSISRFVSFWDKTTRFVYFHCKKFELIYDETWFENITTYCVSGPSRTHPSVDPDKLVQLLQPVTTRQKIYYNCTCISIFFTLWQRMYTPCLYFSISYSWWKQQEVYVFPQFNLLGSTIQKRSLLTGCEGACDLALLHSLNNIVKSITLLSLLSLVAFTDFCDHNERGGNYEVFWCRTYFIALKCLRNFRKPCGHNLCAFLQKTSWQNLNFGFPIFNPFQLYSSLKLFNTYRHTWYYFNTLFFIIKQQHTNNSDGNETEKFFILMNINML